MKLRHLVAITAALAFAASLPLLAVAKGPVANGPGGYGPPGQVDGMPWGRTINPTACQGKQVLNVTFSVANDADSRVGGGYWALDDYQKHVQVFEQSSGNYCAVVRYAGTFTSLDGATDPAGNLISLPAGTHGSMEGGYVGTISGTFSPQPGYATTGWIGRFDFEGDILGPHNAFSWVGAYFSGATFHYTVWSWVYHGGRCGTWYNNSKVDSAGDINCTAS